MEEEEKKIKEKGRRLQLGTYFMFVHNMCKTQQRLDNNFSVETSS